MMRPSSRARQLVALAACLLLGGCAHRRFDPVRETGGALRSTGHRADHAPYGTLAVRRVIDQRPSHEVGSVNYLDDSYFADRLFDREVSAIVRDVFLREFGLAGVFVPIADAALADYELTLTIVHFTCHADRDLVGLIPFIPSIDLEARALIHVLLRDPDGRRFVDTRYEEVKGQTTATIAGVESGAADLLLETLTRVLARAIPEADRGVLQFWREFGRPVPTPQQPG